MYIYKKREGLAFQKIVNLLRRPPEHPRQDVRHRAQKWNVGLERRKGLGTSRADISGNGRLACEPEFNYGRSATWGAVTF